MFLLKYYYLEWTTLPHHCDAKVPALLQAKNVVGNSFSWSGVVQFYGTTLGGVFADNDLRSVNVHTVCECEAAFYFPATLLPLPPLRCSAFCRCCCPPRAAVCLLCLPRLCRLPCCPVNPALRSLLALSNELHSPH